MDIGPEGRTLTPWCDTLRPALTSVSIREEELGRIIATAAIDGQPAAGELLVPPELVVRESCGGIAAAG